MKSTVPPRITYSVCGGYFGDLDYQWIVSGEQDKFIVTQARHVWAASNALLSKPEDPTLLHAATHGFRFLQQKMWDSECGGFFDLVDRRGVPVEEDGNIIKRAYGNAFAIYCNQREYCTRCVIDSVHGGWYWGGIDKEPKNIQSAKASIWKADYHTTRSLDNCIRALRGFCGPGS